MGRGGHADVDDVYVWRIDDVRRIGRDHAGAGDFGEGACADEIGVADGDVLGVDEAAADGGTDAGGMETADVAAPNEADAEGAHRVLQPRQAAVIAPTTRRR